mmetsp:Transcript_37558/g.55302  ORF Transcript_37558/g.55302 Transcript_37558/m.55302 type:complete len:257 (+) Transcript_37558:58-828(+)
MSALSRKKGSAADAEQGMTMDVETGSPSATDKYMKDGPKASFAARSRSSLVTFVLAICTVAAWYLVLAPKDVVAAHKKAVNEKLEELSISIQKHKEVVTAKFEDLTKSVGSETDELISELQSENDLLKNLTETLNEAAPTVTQEHHDEEIAKWKSHHDEEVLKLQSELSSKETEITNLKNDLNNNKDKLEEVKKEIETEKVDLSLFCVECSFDYNGLKTTCGNRKDYLMNVHKDEEDVATEAVMKWDPNCKKGKRN